MKRGFDGGGDQKPIIDTKKRHRYPFQSAFQPGPYAPPNSGTLETASIAPSNRVGASSATSFCSPAKSAWPTTTPAPCSFNEEELKRPVLGTRLDDDLSGNRMTSSAFVGNRSAASNSAPCASHSQPSSATCSTVGPFVSSGRREEGSGGNSAGTTNGKNSDFQCSCSTPLTFNNASSLASTSSSVHFSAPACAQQSLPYVEEQKPLEVEGQQHQHHHPVSFASGTPRHLNCSETAVASGQQLAASTIVGCSQSSSSIVPSSGHCGSTTTTTCAVPFHSSMQPATDYLRPYIHYPATAAAFYHSAASMAPGATTRLDQTGLGDRTVPFPSINNLNNLATGQHPIGTNYSHRYDSAAALSGHPQSLYSSYSAFESPYANQLPPTSHIPLGGAADYVQHPQQHHSTAQAQNQQQQQRYFLARPQPTRLVPASAVSSDIVSPQPPRSQTSPYTLAAAKVDNILNNNNSSGSPLNHPNASSPSTTADTNGNLSPSSSERIDTNSTHNKFRYPSGANNSVQSSSASSPPHLDGRGGRAVTPSSALSSREGTPMPSTNHRDEPPAPNVDISKVQAKELQQHNNKQQQMQSFMQSQVTGAGSSAAVVAAPSLAQQNFHFGMGASPSIAPSSRGFVGSSPTSSYFPSSAPVNSMLDSSIAQRPPKQRPQREASLHVKIGRRPAHLPKVLKFTDKTLPPGWIRKLKQRKHGKQAGRWDVYIYSPCGVKFASRKKLKGFFEKNNLNHDPEDFDFTPYGRHIESRTNHTSNTPGSGVTSGSVGNMDSTTASRHNSSGSTGSNGTHPESCSPSSIPYSPTHSLNNYMPPSMAFSTASTTTAGFMPSGASSFSEYNSFTHFDPHMDNPPNANVLDVPPNDFNPLTAGSTMPYAHLGRGHHHPIINKAGTMGSEFFPSSDMAELIGSSASDLHNGYSSDLKMGLQGIGGVSVGLSIKDEPDMGDKSGSDKMHTCQSSQMVSSASSGCYSTAISASPTSVMANVSHMVSQSSSAGSHCSQGGGTVSHENASEKTFSLGRTMNMLHGGQEGFEDPYFYD